MKRDLIKLAFALWLYFIVAATAMWALDCFEHWKMGFVLFPIAFSSGAIFAIFQNKGWIK